MHSLHSARPPFRVLFLSWNDMGDVFDEVYDSPGIPARFGLWQQRPFEGGHRKCRTNVSR